MHMTDRRQVFKALTLSGSLLDRLLRLSLQNGRFRRIL
jgi:hypothetical protein